jgi:hypothetical protein
MPLVNDDSLIAVSTSFWMWAGSQKAPFAINEAPISLVDTPLELKIVRTPPSTGVIVGISAFNVLKRDVEMP